MWGAPFIPSGGIGCWRALSLSFTGRIDSKGRLTIPLAIRDLFGMYEGASVVIEADPDGRVLILKPLPLRGALVRLSKSVERPGVFLGWLETLEGLREILELRCSRAPEGYSCSSLASADPRAVEKILRACGEGCEAVG